MATVFFSYSHKDEALRNELQTHLAVLERQGVIETWHDRRLVAGDDFSKGISENLECADIVLLLVSPDFLASKYCYDREMTRALERHEAGEARVIPIILRPCDWHETPFGHLLAVPTDGKPVSKFPNLDDAFLEITKAIKVAASKSAAPPKPRKSKLAAAILESEIGRAEETVRSSNLAIKKTFTDHERDAYLDASFEFIAKYFDNSLKELEKRNSQITTQFKKLDATRFTAFVYQDGRSVSECSVRLDNTFGRGQIVYSSQAGSTNSFNEAFGVANNGNYQFLAGSGAATGLHAKHEFSNEGAAGYLWDILIRPLQQ